MANDISKQLNSFVTKLNKALDKVSSLQFLESVGKYTVPMIQGRVRRGYGVEKTDDEEKSFERLSAKYIERREGKKQSGPRSKQKKLTTQEKLSAYTSPSKSNLTFTGKFIESIRYKLFKGKIEIGVSGKHKSGKKTVDNKDILKGHEFGVAKRNLPARPFLHLSANEKKKIRQLFERQLGGAIRSLITK